MELGLCTPQVAMKFDVLFACHTKICKNSITISLLNFTKLITLLYIRL